MANNLSKKSEFQLQITLKEKTEKAFEIVTDLSRFPEIHPLISKVDRLDDNIYLCHETTSILFFPYRFQYSVKVSKNLLDHTTTMESEVQKGVWIKLIFSTNTSVSEPFLSEKIEISGPFLVRKMLSSKLKKVHLQMFENLKKIVFQNT